MCKSYIRVHMHLLGLSDLRPTRIKHKTGKFLKTILFVLET